MMRESQPLCHPLSTNTTNLWLQNGQHLSLCLCTKSLIKEGNVLSPAPLTLHDRTTINIYKMREQKISPQRLIVSREPSTAGGSRPPPLFPLAPVTCCHAPSSRFHHQGITHGCSPLSILCPNGGQLTQESMECCALESSPHS